MKIYFRLTDSGGGANILINGIADALRREGHEFYLDYLPRWVDIVPPAGRFFPNAWPGAEIIHGDVFTGFYPTDKPFIFTLHHVVHDASLTYRSLTQRLYYQLLKRYEQRAINHAAAVVCPSDFTRRELDRVFDCKNARLIYNGIETEFFRPVPAERSKHGIPNNKTVLLFTGNLLRRKGCDLLPKIMRELGPDYLLLLTSGMRSTRPLQIENCINLGSVPGERLPEIYSLCDMLLFPTRLEGFGLSVAEAMACARPVVTSRCSALPELVDDGTTGLLCSPDNVDEFVKKVRWLRKHPEERAAMGTAARQRIVEHFSLQRMTNNYMALYRELLNA
jgi:glycosyltransferase involved in cell wall biosynthesis